jgi:SAM-dependent methyltransferase
LIYKGNMEQNKEWFEHWFDSRFYPLLYDHRDTDEAALFVRQLAQRLEMEEGSKVADIACGEGRFAAQINALGHKVIGIDLSERSISRAKLLEQNDLHFYVHDMRFPFYINYFDYAFNFFTSFGYFETARDNRMAAHAFAACLKDGGTLVIDYLNSHYIQQRLVAHERIEKGGILFDINRYVSNRKIVKDISIVDEQGQPHHFQERVSAFNLQDFVQLFEHEGLRITQLFGDYQLNPFQVEDSPRLIMVFRKDSVL